MNPPTSSQSNSPSQILNLNPDSVAPAVSGSPSIVSSVLPGIRFEVEYTTSGSEPDSVQFDVAEATTMRYLETYLREQFDSQGPFTNVESFLGIGSANQVNPTKISFNVLITFAPDSTIVPTDQDVSVLIQSAFLPPASQTLIDELQLLDTTNPFSTTSNITYTSLVRSGRTSEYANFLSTQFSVEFVFGDEDLTTDELRGVQDATLEYLQSFLIEQFLMKFDVAVITIQWVAVESSNNGLEKTYNVTLFLSEANEYLPQTEDVDTFLEVAFQQPYVKVLLNELQNLPTETTSETLPLKYEDPESKTTKALPVMAFISLFGVILVGSIVFIRRKYGRRMSEETRNILKI